MNRILAVSNDLSVCRQIHAALEGYTVEVALDAVSARMALPEGFDVLLLDAGLGAEGTELVAHVRRVDRTMHIAVLARDHDGVDAFMAAGASRSIARPLTAASLLAPALLPAPAPAATTA
jgi:DNA-binding response OmpR family regulator